MIFDREHYLDPESEFESLDSHWFRETVGLFVDLAKNYILFSRLIDDRFMIQKETHARKSMTLLY
jgi:hypothetical protein